MPGITVWSGRWSVALGVAVVAACSGVRKPEQPAIAEDDACASALRAVHVQRDDGFLGRALALLETPEHGCESHEWLDTRAAVRRELWIDEQATASFAAARRDAGPDEAARARLLYQAGQLLRVADGKYELSLRRFEESYALWPHPLTIVQMGLTHKAAGRNVEYRRANARALAVALAASGGEARAELRVGHAFQVTAVALSPSARIAVTAGHYGKVILWDLTSGRTLLAIDAHRGAVSDVAFSPDGNLLATTGSDENVRIWSTTTGELVGVFFGGEAARIAFGPDGEFLTSAGEDGSLTVWDPKSGARSLGAQPSPVRSIAISKSGLIATGDESGSIQLWDAEDGQQPKVLDAGVAVATLAFNSDGSLLASCHASGLTVWDLTDDSNQSYDDVGCNAMSGLAFQGDDPIVATPKPMDDVVEIRAPGSDANRREIGAPSVVESVAFSPDGTTLIGGGTAESWVLDVASGERAVALSGGGAAVEAIQFDADGKRLAVAAGRTVGTWDLGSGLQLSRVLSRQLVESLTFAPNDEQLAVFGNAGVELWGWRDGTRQEPPPAAKGGERIRAVAYTPDGGLRAVISTGRMMRVRSFRADGGQWQLDSEHELGIAERAALSPDASLVALANGPFVDVLDAASERPIHHLPFRDTIADLASAIWASDVAVSFAFADGNRHLVVAAESIFTAWDLASGALVGEPVSFGRGGQPTLATNGRFLAAASGGDISIYEDLTGAQVRTIPGGTLVSDVEFHPDGHVLAIADGDAVVLWDVEQDRLSATLLQSAAGEWVVTAPDGRIDGSRGPDGGESLVYWQVGEFQLPGFVGWQRYHSPGLLRDVAGGEPLPQQ